MPIYEFYSAEANKVYSFLAKSLAYGDKTPRCPDDARFTMEKRVTGFAFVGTAKDPSELAPLDDMGDAKMERVMAELEGDMRGFDEDNPDPKQMAHVMRKMADLTGDRLPGEMEEMMRRLESGEDPEALEAELGDSMDESFDNADAEAEGGGAADKIRRMRRKLLGPKRDPKLYDMSEYCD